MENATSRSKITNECEKLANSEAPNKVGVFQLVEDWMDSRMIDDVLKHLRIHRSVRKGTRWLLIFDVWNEKEEYARWIDFEEDCEKRTLMKYPVIGVRLSVATRKMKTVYIRELPYNKLHVEDRTGEYWKRLS